MALLRKTALLISVVALAAASASAKTPEPDAAPPAPALWRVSDEDSSVYLFGAIGLSPQGAAWRSRTVARAIDASETIWFEAPVDEPTAQAAANRIFSEEGMLPKGERLSSLLPSEAAKALPVIAELSGLTMEALEPLRPWAAFVVLSSRVNTDRPGDTIEQSILKEARGRARELRYFDTIENSLRILTAMPQPAQQRLLAQFIADFSRQRAHAPDSFEAWRTGDLAALGAHLSATLRADAPDAYELLVARRAETLANGVVAALTDDRVAFISLSAGYVVGPDALPDRLKELGLTVERIGEE